MTERHRDRADNQKSGGAEEEEMNTVTQSVQVPDNQGGFQVEAAEGEVLSRRDFLRLGMAILGTVAALEAGTAGLMYFRSHSMKGEFGSLVTAGYVDDFQPGSVTEFAESRFFLVRVAEGGFLAVHSRCPHLGCTVQWIDEEQEFLCPCHASRFDIHGSDHNPPVARPLDTFPVTIEDEQVIVDTTQITERSDYSPDQLTQA